MSIIEGLARRFAQLYIPPHEGASSSPLYRSIVNRGAGYEGSLDHFTGSEDDSLTLEVTPYGSVEVLYLANRADFECFYRIMACRCEPMPVPASMGACFLSGFNDWSRINAHMAEYRLSGGTDTALEFRRFTSQPSNYKGRLLLLSRGPYSALPARRTPYSPAEWLDISLGIRRHHELTHFVSRQLCPDERHALWDELLADCMGLMFAAKGYDAGLALAFLGIEGGAYTGGRLANYLSCEPDEDSIRFAVETAQALERECAAWPPDASLYGLMEQLIKNPGRIAARLM